MKRGGCFAKSLIVGAKCWGRLALMGSIMGVLLTSPAYANDDPAREPNGEVSVADELAGQFAKHDFDSLAELLLHFVSRSTSPLRNAPGNQKRSFSA